MTDFPNGYILYAFITGDKNSGSGKRCNKCLRR